MESGFDMALSVEAPKREEGFAFVKNETKEEFFSSSLVLVIFIVYAAIIIRAPRRTQCVVGI